MNTQDLIHWKIGKQVADYIIREVLESNLYTTNMAIYFGIHNFSKMLTWAAAVQVAKESKDPEQQALIDNIEKLRKVNVFESWDAQDKLIASIREQALVRYENLRLMAIEKRLGLS